MLSTSVIDRILARAGLVSGLSSAEVQRRLEAGVKDEDLSKRRVSFYLLEMEEGELYSDPGYASTLDYAARRLKLDERRTHEPVGRPEAPRSSPHRRVLLLGPPVSLCEELGAGRSCSCWFGSPYPTPRRRGCSAP